MRNRILGIAAILCILLTGCTGHPTPQKAVVREITVTSGDHTKIFTRQSDMIRILDGLRNHGQLTTPPIDPDTISGDRLSIVLTRTDGSQLRYDLKAGRYIRRNREPWREMNPHIYGELWNLLEEMVLDQGTRSELDSIL